MLPISPFNTPSPLDAPHRPPSRMEVERHRLEDTRANYLRMEIDTRGNQESRLAAPRRSIRLAVATLLIAAGQRLHQEPGAEPTDSTVTA